MAKSNLWDSAAEKLRKALGGKPKDDDDVDPDKLEQGTEDEDDDDDDEEDVSDATPVLKALAEHIEKLEESNGVMQKALASLMEQGTQNVTLQKSIGESLLAVMEQTRQIAASPAPRKGAVSALEAASALQATALQATMAKGGFGGGNEAVVRHGLFTPSDMDDAKDILSKAMSDGKLTLAEVARAEGQLNKAMRSASSPIDRKFVNILCDGKQE